MNAPVSRQAPPPALVVISGGANVPCAAPARRHDAVFSRLLKALPAATRVLEIGCGQGDLALAYKQARPGCHWLGVDADAAALERARLHMDATLYLNLQQDELPPARVPFDLIVVNRLEHLPRAPQVLAALGTLLAPGGQLIVLAENHACLSAMARLIEADLSTGVAPIGPDSRALDAGLPRHQSPSTIYKMLLDAGWTPDLLDHEPDAPIDDKLTAAARYMGDALGVPLGSADRAHRMRHLIIRSERSFDAPVAESTQALFDVVVPTTKEQQLRVNVAQSPGLHEVQARIISYRRAASPAEALNESLPHVQRDWVLLCHQDVYFPKGFGQRLNAVLAAIPEAERATSLIGFIGMGVNRQTQQVDPAGFVIDRFSKADHAASDTVISIDELAIVLPRDGIHQIDPLIGWHLWATDLCLNAITAHQVFPRIVRLPLFHNTQSGWQLPEAFHASAQYLLQKHPEFAPIRTLCGTIDQAFVAQHRSTQA